MFLELNLFCLPDPNTHDTNAMSEGTWESTRCWKEITKHSTLKLFFFDFGFSNRPVKTQKSETAAVKNLWNRDHMPFQVSSSADHHGRGWSSRGSDLKEWSTHVCVKDLWSWRIRDCRCDGIFWTDTALTRQRSRYGYGVVTSMLRFDTTSEMSFQCSQENVKYPGNWTFRSLWCWWSLCEAVSWLLMKFEKIKSQEGWVMIMLDPFRVDQLVLVSQFIIIRI